MFPTQSIALLGHMCYPSDPKKREKLMALLRAWGSGGRIVPERLNRIQYEWVRVADVLQSYYDLHKSGHQARRGGPSVGKAVELVAAIAKHWGTGKASLWKLWSTYRDVAHLITAAALVASDVKQRHRQKPFPRRLHELVPFQLVMFVPELIVAAALGFQRFGLETVPHSRDEPSLSPETLWRIPDHCNVEPIAPPVRGLRKQDIVLLNTRRAGNRGKSRKRDAAKESFSRKQTKKTILDHDRSSNGPASEDVKNPD